ncbi:MAG: YabP/YqfC family sporulation protein, partial [Lachnospira sp.]|nr:YabP/YqfC family sporulation protein [Lachnospira sp.]
MSDDYTFRMPIVTAIGHKEVHIDNFRSIIEYDRCAVSLTTKCGIVRIEGSNLEIMYYDQEEIAVKGII